MKKAISLMLALCLAVLCMMLPAVATEGEEQTILWLNHQNVVAYDLNGSDTPMPASLAEDNWYIGDYSVDKTKATFINIDGDNDLDKTPGWVAWDIEPNTYTTFACLFGKGSWNHSAGAKCRIDVLAVDLEDGTIFEESIVASSDWVAYEDDPVYVKGTLPDWAERIVIRCYDYDQRIGLCSCIIANALVCEGEPPAEQTEPIETDPPATNAPQTNAPDTDPQDDDTDAAQTEKPEEKDGCGSMIVCAALPVLLACGALGLKKKH